MIGALRHVRVTAAALCLSAALAAGATPGPQDAPAAGPGRQSPEGGVPQATRRHYSLAARVRPLLFWVGKDNVGEGHISWLSRQNGERGYELLIGSLPDRAPRRINRWGYISEVEEGPAVRVLGFMTEVDEETYEQAEATSGGIPQGSRPFKVIQGTVAGATATSNVSGVALSDKLTLRDLDKVAAQVPAPGGGVAMAVPAGTERGFLFAMASLLRENVETAVRTGAPPVSTARSYVYGKKLYEVTTRSSRLLKQTVIRGRAFTDVIDSQFEARQRGKGGGAKFRLVYGTAGDLREVPVRIVYRPKWWFEADLVLLPDPVAPRS